VKRKPPRLIEGAFRNAFVNAPQGDPESGGSSDEVEKQIVWPPPRKRKVSGQPNPEKGKVKVSVSKSPNTVKTGSSKAFKFEHNPSEANEVTKPSAQVNAQALKSRRALTPPPPPRVALFLKPSKAEHHPFSQPVHNQTRDVDQKTLKATPDAAAEHSNKEHIPIRSDSLGNRTEIRKAQQPTSSDSIPTLKSEYGRFSRPEAGGARISALQTSSRVVTLAGPSRRRSSNLRHETKLVDHSPPRDSHTPGNPFVAPRAPVRDSKGKGKARASNLFDRRHTIDHVSEIPTPQHVDLRPRSLNQARQSLPAPSHTHIPTPTSTPDSASQPSLLPIPIAAEDRFKVEYLGMSAAVGIISKRFSVAEEVVWRGWERTKSISKTEEYCRRLAELNARSEAAVLKEMRKSGILEETPARARPVRSTAGSPRSRWSSRQHKLKITPRLDDDAMSEYTPPSSTRAAHYNRLKKQGRKDEALVREWRRASFGGGPFPQQHSAPENRPSSLAPETLDRHMNVGQTDYIPGGTPPATPSLTPSGENGEAEHEDELGELDEIAFLSANAKNAEALREIERKVDPDLMVQWTAGLLVQLRDRASQLP
jgi:hypothetical protein